MFSSHKCLSIWVKLCWYYYKLYTFSFQFRTTQIKHSIQHFLQMAHYTTQDCHLFLHLTIQWQCSMILQTWILLVVSYFDYTKSGFAINCLNSICSLNFICSTVILKKSITQSDIDSIFNPPWTTMFDLYDDIKRIKNSERNGINSSKIWRKDLRNI